MRLTSLSALLLFASCTAVPNGTAPPPVAEDYGTTEGESLLTVGGSLSNSEPDGGEDITALVLQAGYGRFITDVHEVGGTVLAASSDSGGFDVTIFSILPYYNYNIRQSARTWYYFGPHLGFLTIDTDFDDETELSFGVHGGVRQWITPSTSWFVEPRFTTSSSLDDFTILAGLNVKLDI